MVNKFYIFILFIVFSLTTTLASAANISVFVDRQNINTNESFNLVFEADGSVDDEPDFSPLGVYFDVLNKSKSSNMTIVNGSFSRKTVWTVVLLAKQAGTYAIPPIEFGKDKTKALTIKIGRSSGSQSSTDKNIFLEVDVDQKSAYVQSQLVYTVKLFRSVDIQNASLTEPELSDADAIVEKLGDDNRTQITRNGVRYLVIERKYAIFPQQSGQLSIKPVEFNGQLVSQRRSFFDITPFNNTTKRIVSSQIDIDVKPIPGNFKNKNWLPSASLKLVDEWPEDPVFKVGEPVTRTLSIIASGLTASQLPEINSTTISNIKLYPDQPTFNNQKDENGILGIRQEKIAYIPTKSGKITLPEINIPWWNTKNGKIEFARIKAKTINVEAGASVTQPALTPTEQRTLPHTQSNSTELSDSTTSSTWFYLSMLFLAGWVITLFFLLRSNKKQVTPQTTTPEPKLPTKNISKKLASACHQHNRELCKSLLIEWAKQQWPDAQINTLGDIVLKTDGALMQQIIRLNQSLYADTSTNWDASELLNAFEKHKGKPLTNESNQKQKLKSLSELQ